MFLQLDLGSRPIFHTPHTGFEWACWALSSLVLLPALMPASAAGVVQSASWSDQLKWYGTAAGLLIKIPTSLFFFVELAVMGPRAVKGHQWYRQTFGAKYPQKRKAVLPGLL